MAGERDNRETEIAYQRELHRRAKAGDSDALNALYRSMLPLIKSRVRRVLARHHESLGGWYELDDLIQDAYLVFHRFVMTSDPEVPLFRLLAGAFERALRTYLCRRGPLRRELPVVTSLPDGWDEDPLSAAWQDGARHGGCLCGGDHACGDGYPGRPFELACARALLDALPSDREREVVRLAAAGFTAREAARQLGCSIASLRYHRRHIRAFLAMRGIISDSRRTD